MWKGKQIKEYFTGFAQCEQRANLLRISTLASREMNKSDCKIFPILKKDTRILISDLEGQVEMLFT
jgi:hypothetical protein